jgi:hypothetical protein
MHDGTYFIIKRTWVRLCFASWTVFLPRLKDGVYDDDG